MPIECYCFDTYAYFWYSSLVVLPVSSETMNEPAVSW